MTRVTRAFRVYEKGVEHTCVICKTLYMFYECNHICFSTKFVSYTGLVYLQLTGVYSFYTRK